MKEFSHGKGFMGEDIIKVLGSNLTFFEPNYAALCDEFIQSEKMPEIKPNKRYVLRVVLEEVDVIGK